MKIERRVINKLGATIGYDIMVDGKLMENVDIQHLMPYKDRITNAVYVGGKSPYFRGKTSIPVREGKQETFTLYHGSKQGLRGAVNYKYGRKECDFGQGFYLGTTAEQPLGLIAPRKYPNAVLYTMELNLTGLNTYAFKDDMYWVLFVCYNRGRLSLSQYPQLKGLIQRFNTILTQSDIIIGTIADDRMSLVLEEFYTGARSDIGVLECLQCANLGKQVVLKSDKACRRLTIKEATPLTQIMRDTTTAKHADSQQKAAAFVSDSLRKDNITMRGHRFAWILENWEGNWNEL